MAATPRSSFPTLLAIALVLCLTAPPLHAQQAGREGLSFLDTGPIRVREQFLPNMAFLAFDPASADVLDAGRWQVDLVQSVTNTWAQSVAVQRVLERRDRAPITRAELRDIEPEGAGEGIFLVDGELARTSLSIRRGLGSGVQLQLVVPVLDFGGGVGDSLITDFHDAFGFEQDGRLGVPEDAYTVYLRDDRGREVSRNAAPGAGLGDLSLGVKVALPSGDAGFRWALEGQVKAPTGSEDHLYGSGAWDAGVQVVATHYFERSCLHLAAGALLLGESDVYRTDSQVRLSGMFGWERALGRATSAVVQVTVAQSPFDDLGLAELEELAYLVDVGVKHGLSERTVLFVAASENFANFDNSADFGVHAGLTYTL